MVAELQRKQFPKPLSAISPLSQQLFKKLIAMSDFLSLGKWKKVQEVVSGGKDGCRTTTVLCFTKKAVCASGWS